MKLGSITQILENYSVKMKADMNYFQVDQMEGFFDMLEYFYESASFIANHNPKSPKFWKYSYLNKTKQSS